jgi:para-aminobenzoate synthetase
MLSRQGAPDAVQLYRTLRAINPAPYAAWLRFGAGGSAGGDSGGGGSGSTTASSADLQLCCCSPERFLKGDRGGQLEAKPIKGTAPRSADPKLDAQAAAELAGKLGLGPAVKGRAVQCTQ